MKSRSEMVAILRTMAHKMQPILIEAKIKPSHIEIPAESDNIPLVCLEEGILWLQGIYNGAYHKVTIVKKLLPEELWQHYRLMDMEDTIEIQDLNKSLRVLRDAIINKLRPIVFRKVKFNARFRNAPPKANESKDTKTSGEKANTRTRSKRVKKASSQRIGPECRSSKTDDGSL